MKHDAHIYLAGHRGLVGSAIVRALQLAGYANLLLASHEELDLCDQAAVHLFFDAHKPEYVILAAARVGGIAANAARPVDFLYDNLMIQSNVIHAAANHGAHKLLFLGSTCIYPRLAPQPLKEAYLLTGPLEPTNEWYAVAKIAGIKLCQAYRQQYGLNFISAMPTNLYGPGDNFDAESSHVLAALIRKFHSASQEGEAELTLWGSGKPLREFLHVDDLAEATLHLLEHYDEAEPINIGCGRDISIQDLAAMMMKISGYQGKVLWDDSKPDGTPRKLVDVSKLSALGWKPSIPLRRGVEETYAWYANESKKGP